MPLQLTCQHKLSQKKKRNSKRIESGRCISPNRHTLGARRAKLAGDFCNLSATVAVEPQTGSFPLHVSQMRPPVPEASLVSQPVGPAVQRASYKTLLLLFPLWELVIAALKTHFPLLLSMWIPPDREREGERNNNCISYDGEMNNFNCVCALRCV